MRRTTISISEELWQYIKSLQNLGETKEDIIWRLIKQYERLNLIKASKNLPEDLRLILEFIETGDPQKVQRVDLKLTDQ